MLIVHVNNTGSFNVVNMNLQVWLRVLAEGLKTQQLRGFQLTTATDWLGVFHAEPSSSTVASCDLRQEQRLKHHVSLCLDITRDKVGLAVGNSRSASR